jgi:hypothetical protein
VNVTRYRCERSDLAVEGASSSRRRSLDTDRYAQTDSPTLKLQVTVDDSAPILRRHRIRPTGPGARRRRLRTAEVTQRALDIEPRCTELVHLCVACDPHLFGGTLRGCRSSPSSPMSSGRSAWMRICRRHRLEADLRICRLHAEDGIRTGDLQTILYPVARRCGGSCTAIRP